LAESPLVTLGRLLGGVVLMQGDLGHQVLGQLLVMGSNEVAIAGAALVVAGTRGRRNVVGEIALRTVAPALAGRALLQKQENRIDRKQTILDAKEKKLDERERKSAAREQAVCKQELDLEMQRAALGGQARKQQNDLDQAAAVSRSPEPVTTVRAAPAAAPAPSAAPRAAARAGVKRPPATKKPAAKKPAAPPPRIGRKKR
jgi:DNA-binding protein HU-beta